MAFSVQEIRKRLQMWLDAEEAIANGQSYSIDNRRLERANLAQVREQIKFWKKELIQAEEKTSGRSKRRVIRVVPRDL
ncbi:DUF6148 family protein [Lysinibacillus capsici]|uniref:DUF6148 family protein n=1 Tax=Lysinibacillus capsici TaxID=2115968 RepID=UPI0006CA3078|nr:DUF6148 family protein [Lysinibacillus sphaericus]